MKILFFPEHYPPMDGGIATSAQRIAFHLQAVGNDVTVFTFDNTRRIDVGDYCNVSREDGLPIYRFGPFFAKNKNIDKANGEFTTERDKAILRRRVFMQMYGAAQTMGFDAILSLAVINAGFMSQYLANMLHIPHVAGARGNDVGTNLFDTSRYAVVAQVLRSSRRIVAVNHHLKRRIEMACPDVSDKITVIKNGVCFDKNHRRSSEQRRMLVERCGWSPSDLIVAFAGSLREKKGAGVLLKALQRANDKPDCRVRFLLIGPQVKDKDVQKFEDAWNTLKCDNLVYVTGQIERRDVAGWYSCADVVVMPSVEDGMSNGLLEGMEAGLCPLATQLFGDVVANGKNGVLVKTNDADALAEGMRMLFERRDLVEQYGRAAREQVQIEHDPMDEARQYSKVLEEACRCD